MTNRSVQQDARPAVAQYYGHLAGRCRARIKVEHRLINRFFSVIMYQFVTEPGVIKPPATTGTTLLTPAVILDDDLNRQTDQRAHIGGTATIMTRYVDHLVFTSQTRHYLRHPRIKCACD